MSIALLFPHKDVLRLIGKKLAHKNLGAIRAVSHFFYEIFTPLWDTYVIPRLTINKIIMGHDVDFLFTESGEIYYRNYFTRSSWIKLLSHEGTFHIFIHLDFTYFLTTNDALLRRHRDSKVLTPIRPDIPIQWWASTTEEMFILSEGNLLVSRNSQLWEAVSSREPVCALAAGSLHALFLTAAGEVYGRGYSAAGQLGTDPSFLEKLNFTLLTNLRARAIRAHGENSLLITTEDEVFGCGKLFGFAWVKIAENIRDAILEENHCLLLSNTGEVFGFSLSSYCPALGIGSISSLLTLIKLSEHQDVKLISTSERESLLVTNSQKIISLGDKQREVIFNPFHNSETAGKKKPYNIRALINNRYFLFQPQPIKEVFNQCEKLYEDLCKNKPVHYQELLTTFKKNISPDTLQILPAGLAQDFQDLQLEGFVDFYNKLRGILRLEPVKTSFHQKKCVIM